MCQDALGENQCENCSRTERDTRARMLPVKINANTAAEHEGDTRARMLPVKINANTAAEQKGTHVPGCSR